MDTPCPADRLEIIDCISMSSGYEMRDEVLAGLTAQQKYLPSKYFYDCRGSALFEQICRLPEYYQTRTELSILRAEAGQLMKEMSRGSIIDLGSGANWKVRVLLDAVAGSLSEFRYVPVDVCAQAVRDAAADLIARYPALKVTGLIADLTRGLDAITFPGRKLFTFFGSTIGNFRDEQAAAFLENIGGSMAGGDRLLLGLDLVKDRNVLESAYNDRQGVTARFNLNILSCLNRELEAGFDLNVFDHLAFYNEERRQVEMHLRARSDVRVTIAGVDHELRVSRGETILTEICRKYDREAAEEMLASAGLRIARWMVDPREWFALAEVVPVRA